MSVSLITEQKIRWQRDNALCTEISGLSGEFKISADALVAHDFELTLSCEDLYISTAAVSSKLNTEIERSMLSDEALIEDVSSLSSEHLTLSGRYDSTFVSIDKSADQG